jgi:hypothetical protein
MIYYITPCKAPYNYNKKKEAAMSLPMLGGVVTWFGQLEWPVFWFWLVKNQIRIRSDFWDLVLEPELKLGLKPNPILEPELKPDLKPNPILQTRTETGSRNQAQFWNQN